MTRTTIIIGAVVAAIILALSSLYIVDERQKALVLRFGQIKQIQEEPGLYFKLPFIDEPVYYDARIQSLDTPETEVTPSDDRRLVVDSFARYRIIDVGRFRESIGVEDQRRFSERQLNGILNDEIRGVLGAAGVTSDTILSPERSELMVRIRDGADAKARAFGLTVIDVRLKQTNLPDNNLDATLRRMVAERDREAADEIARGNEAAQRVRAQADRTVTELISEANREATIVRGEADAERNRIFAQAFTQDPEFFEFYRSMAAYESALRSGNTTMVMSPNSEFFGYLQSDNPLDVDLESLSLRAEDVRDVTVDEEGNRIGSNSGELDSIRDDALGTDDAEGEDATDPETAPSE